jgi:hypothetical protein
MPPRSQQTTKRKPAMQHDCPTQVQSESNVPQTNAHSSVDLMFRAFSDRTRLRILSLLRNREFCVV